VSPSDAANGDAAPLLLPSLVGRHVELRPVAPVDHDWLYRQAIDPRVGGRWRLHGVVPSFDVFMQILTSGAEATFVVIGHTDGERLGLVQLLAFDERRLHGHLSAFFSPEAQDQAWPLEGLALYVRHVFFVYGLRKLYVESLEPDAAQYRSLVGVLLEEEGRLVGHERVGDRWYDSIIYALHRDRWHEHESRLLG
jgi:RimJ/RimL family protein N-acetyltransferase